MKDRQTKQGCEKIALDYTINILASSIQVTKGIDYNIKKLEDRWQNNDLSRTTYKITEGITT
jgi:hypothetical protein